MILSFKTKINGKPTFFVEKIHSGLLQNGVTNFEGISFENKEFDLQKLVGSEPKLHTIRRDKEDLWEKGTIIDFVIDNDSEQFQFAPQLPVISTQDIFITRRGYALEITIAKVGSYMGDDDFYLLHLEKELLAKNDGFDTYEDFVLYFLDKIEANGRQTGNFWYSGKIIHWTDLMY